MNINIGVLLVALAIHAGMDTGGAYQSCYNTLTVSMQLVDICQHADSMPVSTSWQGAGGTTTIWTWRLTA
ncbi:hypothetical protein EAO14_28190 [Klebsiella pneumoniae]|nr:hypothetical protein EAO14_28190 [Klebsiella pneumoniae]